MSKQDHGFFRIEVRRNEKRYLRQVTCKCGKTTFEWVWTNRDEDKTLFENPELHFRKLEDTLPVCKEQIRASKQHASKRSWEEILVGMYFVCMGLVCLASVYFAFK